MEASLHITLFKRVGLCAVLLTVDHSHSDDYEKDSNERWINAVDSADVEYIEQGSPRSRTGVKARCREVECSSRACAEGVQRRQSGDISRPTVDSRACLDSGESPGEEEAESIRHNCLG